MIFGHKSSVSEKTAIAFIKWHFANAGSIFDGPEFEAFRKLVAEGKDIAAAEEYHKLTGTKIEEAHFAVTYAKSLKANA